MSQVEGAAETLAHDVAKALERAARAAGAVAREAFVSGATGVEHKQGFHDVVTAADREAERVATGALRARFPDARIVGEEDGASGRGEIAFFIDPIDGTSNFASGLPFFCTSIGAFLGDAPIGGCVYDPMRDEMFLAENGALSLNGVPVLPRVRGTRDRDVELLTHAPHEGSRPDDVALSEFAAVVAAFRAVRRLGSCALHLAYVAVGRAAVSHELKFGPWDIAAGLQLVAAGGGQLAAWDAAGRRLAAPLRTIEAVARVVSAGPGFALESASLPGLGRPIPAGFTTTRA
ncbi:MAG: inositol monophosphatase [Alphaproteobacteria bacterium]|nr:inositol monophosphatase [Alphaproteobacteria bacterium]